MNTPIASRLNPDAPPVTRWHCEQIGVLFSGSRRDVVRFLLPNSVSVDDHRKSVPVAYWNVCRVRIPYGTQVWTFGQDGYGRLLDTGLPPETLLPTEPETYRAR